MKLIGVKDRHSNKSVINLSQAYFTSCNMGID